MDTITGMRTFCAVATEDSFVKAARRLGFSPALTSKYVGQLEERLGVQLLHRTTRSLSLTEAGLAYFKRCRLILEEFDELEESVQATKASPRGVLRISAPVTFGETHLVDAIADFLTEYPDISVDLDLTDSFVNLIEEGYDLAIRFGDLEDSTLVAKKIAGTAVVLCASPQYLDQAPAITQPSDLQQHACVIDSNFKGGSHWPFVIKDTKQTINVTGRVRVNSATATRALLLKHKGIALCPYHVVADDLATGRLVSLLPQHNAFDVSVHVLYPQNRHLALKVRVFIDFLILHFAGLKAFREANAKINEKPQSIR